PSYSTNSPHTHTHTHSCHYPPTLLSFVLCNGIFCCEKNTPAHYHRSCRVNSRRSFRLSEILPTSNAHTVATHTHGSRRSVRTQHMPGMHRARKGNINLANHHESRAV